MSNAYLTLENVFTTLAHLNHIERMMIWDEATMMPPGGGLARAQALATLKGIQHETLTHPKNLALIERAKDETTLTAWQEANLMWMEKKIRNNVCLPIDLVKALAASAVKSEQAWRRYRPDNHWRDLLPHLEKTFRLVKESAQIRAEIAGLSAYDVLIDDYCPGMTQKTIDPIFDALKVKLPPLIEHIIDKQQHQPIIQPEGPFDIAKQQALGKTLMRAIGFDFHHGRLDISHHPFCGGVPEDVRITTRYREDEFISALLGICHETGHALYEQNLPKKWRHQPVGQVLGMAVHESQSLIFEMQACRTHSFMQFLSKQLQQHFGNDPAFEYHNLYRLHTRVQRSFIRVDADEVTYPLHVILRYDIEKNLLNGALTLRDLPDIWDAKMTEYLGLSTQGNDADGVMQDVHWPAGTFGYFPAYTLGRLMAAQLFERAIEKYPSITSDLAHGNFHYLRKWLAEHVHAYASFVSNDQLLKIATGKSLHPDYFIRHVKVRYGVESCVS